MRGARSGLALAAIGLLGACAPDYSAVREWSLEAREAVLPPAFARGPVPVAAPAPAAAITAEGRLGAVEALREGAAAWLSLLAYIADDGLPAERENPLTALVAKVAPYDEAGAAALSQLGEVMAFAARRNWRAPFLAYAVERGDPPFQDVMAALARQVEALSAEQPGRAEEEARIAPLIAAATRPEARAALEELQEIRRAALVRRRAAEDARRAAITRVAEGHALLAERKKVLAQMETARLLRIQASDLRRLLLPGAGG